MRGLSFSVLVHTEWFGISLTDVFFPCFVFLAGASAGINASKKKFGEDWLKNAIVSKPLWTAPYVLVLSGCFLIILPAVDYLVMRYKI